MALKIKTMPSFERGDNVESKYIIKNKVPTNTPICLPDQYAYSFPWSIHILHAQCRGVKTPLCNFLWI